MKQIDEHQPDAIETPITLGPEHLATDADRDEFGAARAKKGEQAGTDHDMPKDSRGARFSRMTIRGYGCVLALILVSGLGIIAILLFLVVPGTPPGVTKENFARVHKGMTERRVQALLGRPADRVRPDKNCCSAEWYEDGYWIRIAFEDGLVDHWATKEPNGQLQYIPREEGVVATIRRWFTY